MNTTLSHLKKLSDTTDQALIISDKASLARFGVTAPDKEYLEQRMRLEIGLTAINNYERHRFFILSPKETDIAKRREYFRRKGYELAKMLFAEKIKNIELSAGGTQDDDVLALAEGLALSNYEFLKYKTDKLSKALHSIGIHAPNLHAADVEELANVIDAVFIARDLVNEPVIYLTAEQLGKEITALGKEAGFDTEVFGKQKIRALKMGGLLAVNAGSQDEPTFSVSEYRHPKAVNAKPIILVGKGVTFDSGGLNIKLQSMVYMKSDMAGAAAVMGAIFAAAKNRLPLWIIALVPSTDNRPGENAIAPGDVITLHNGTTVEIIDTDAEGRLILGDALSYAQGLNPELVIDVATLTGSAARALGKEGMVCMGTAPAEVKEQLNEAGNDVCERMVEFPLWDDYEEQVKSDLADIKNYGGPEAGAITAGMFLKHFTEYPWMHLDIAGCAFLEKGEWNYRGKNGSGVGVRLLYRFLKMQAG
ncbi:MAG: peptidase M17 [Bacteroidota bacterium]